jgi:hypothetical protein
MGCCNEKMMMGKSRFNLMLVSEEEDIIKLKEKSLPFSTTKVMDLEAVIKQNQFDGVLSIAQLRKSLTQLEFDLELFTIPEIHIAKLLQILQNPRKLYEVRTILLCGILLCEGTTSDKANMLFNLYDSKRDTSLDKDVIKDMVYEIIDMSVKKIPKIAVDDNEEPEPFTIDTSKLETYTNGLLSKSETLVEKVITKLMEDQYCITQTDFIKRISRDSFLESLLWSYRIRLELSDCP